MKRGGRLASAKKWLESFEGKNPIRGYSRWYGVDLLCAVAELQMLGVQLDRTHVEQIRVTMENRKKQAQRRKKQAKRRKEEAAKQSEFESNWSDENFSFIAGYTSGGMPFGVPWPEDDEEKIWRSGVERRPEMGW